MPLHNIIILDILCSWAGVTLWNNILEPLGNKSITWGSAKTRFLCPTPEHPYIFTYENSRQTAKDDAIGNTIENWRLLCYLFNLFCSFRRKFSCKTLVNYGLSCTWTPTEKGTGPNLDNECGISFNCINFAVCSSRGGFWTMWILANKIYC